MSRVERIVVGIDDSPASRSALHWAVVEARAHRATVEAWHAWYLTDPGDGPPPDAVAAEKAARTVLEQAVDGIAGVRTVLIRALAASALLDASRSADLLVLGADPGPGLGAVTGRVVAHAECPVVLVPRLAGSRQDTHREVTGIESAGAGWTGDVAGKTSAIESASA